MDAIRPERMRSGSWPHIAVMYLVGIIAFIAMGTLGPLVGDFARAYSASVQEVGVLISLQVLCGAVIGAFVGWVIDRVGPRLVMMSGALLLLLSNVTNIITGSFSVSAASFLVQGVGLVAMVLGGQVTLSTGIGSGKRQAQALALWSTAPFVGVALGMFIAAPFADGEHWRRALVIEVALSALAMVLVAVAPRMRVTVEKTNPFAVFGSGRVLRLAIVFGMISLVGQGNNTVVSLYISRAHEVSVGAAASLLGLANLAGILGSFAMAGALSRGLAPSKLIWVIAVAGICGGTLIYAPTFGLYASVAGLVIWTTVMGATVAFVYTLVVRVAPHPSQIGAAAGLVNQGSGIGIVFAAPLYLSIYASGRWQGFLIAIALAWAAAVLLAPVRGLARQPAAPSSLKASAGTKALALVSILIAGVALSPSPLHAATATRGVGAISEQGLVLYQEKCVLCHDSGAMGALMLTKRLGVTKSDLTRNNDLSAAYVRAIVRNGLNGMPYFTRVELTNDELTAVATYLSRHKR